MTGVAWQMSEKDLQRVALTGHRGRTGGKFALKQIYHWNSDDKKKKGQQKRNLWCATLFFREFMRAECFLNEKHFSLGECAKIIRSWHGEDVFRGPSRTKQSGLRRERRQLTGKPTASAGKLIKLRSLLHHLIGLFAWPGFLREGTLSGLQTCGIHW